MAFFESKNLVRGIGEEWWGEGEWWGQVEYPTPPLLTTRVVRSGGVRGMMGEEMRGFMRENGEEEW